MSIFAQHGYGKSVKIEEGLRNGSLSGVVLSPRDETPERIKEYIALLRDEFSSNVVIAFDPQFYATTVTPVRDGCLPDYPYYESGLTRGRFVSQSELNRYATLALQYQARLDVSYLVAPTVLFNDFRDPWSQIALSLGQEAVAVHQSVDSTRPLMISLAVDEGALRSQDALNEFLDIITVWDIYGVYLVVRRNDQNYPATFDETALANLLYLVYALAEVNGFQVVCGYTDMIGILLHAVGATATATGWFNTLRQFTLRRFQPSNGGATPRLRYTSAQLLNSIFVVPELQTAYQLGLASMLLSDTDYDAPLSIGNPANAPWPQSESCQHHWQVLKRLAEQASAQGSVSNNLSFVEQRIQQAIALYRMCESAGVRFDAATSSRELEVWLRAIRSFKADAGL